MVTKRIDLAVRLLLLCWIIPIIISCIVYYGFTTNYSTNVFSESGFKQQYENGIYKYRILGTSLLLKTYDLIKSYNLPVPEFRSIKSIDPNGQAEFYAAYFYLNTFFFCLTCTILFLVLLILGSEITVFIYDVTLLFITLLIALSQYVIVPYDMLTTFFLSLSALLTLNNRASLVNSIILCLIVILSALTHESTFVILAFYVTIKFDSVFNKRLPFTLNHERITLLVMGLCFIIVYLSLRIEFGFEQAFFQFVRLGSNLTRFYPLAGILLFISLVVLFLTNRLANKETTIFLLASSPYIISILALANPWEIRLWVPIIILSVILNVAHFPKTAAVK
jgi:hypothetical protein